MKSVTEIARDIRKTLNREFKASKFSVRSTSNQISITLKSGAELFSPELLSRMSYERCTREYYTQFHNRCSVNHYREANAHIIDRETRENAVGEIRGWNYTTYADSSRQYDELVYSVDAEKLISRVLELLHGSHIDNSDTQYDHYDQNYYMSFEIGSYEKDYQVTK